MVIGNKCYENMIQPFCCFHSIIFSPTFHFVEMSLSFWTTTTTHESLWIVYRNSWPYFHFLRPVKSSYMFHLWILHFKHLHYNYDYMTNCSTLIFSLRIHSKVLFNFITNEFYLQLYIYHTKVLFSF